MKTISFYNEKGGVGKSTFSMIYASWLRYKHGKKVAVVDLNKRVTSYRATEVKIKTDLQVIDQYDLDKVWPIIIPKKEDLNKFEGQMLPLSHWLNDKIRNELSDMDVLVIDLPGAASNRELASMIFGKHVGLFVIPTDRGQMSTRATVATCNAINLTAKYNVRTAVFLNQIQTYVSVETYEAIAETLMGINIPVLPDMIAFSERLKAIGRENIICSTLEYPDWNLDAFRGSRDLGLENLFIDVTRLLKDSMEHENTGPADLSFVDALEKEFRNERQLMHSSFAELDFPPEAFPEKRRIKKT